MATPRGGGGWEAPGYGEKKARSVDSNTALDEVDMQQAATAVGGAH